MKKTEKYSGEISKTFLPVIEKFDQEIKLLKEEEGQDISLKNKLFQDIIKLFE